MPRAYSLEKIGSRNRSKVFGACCDLAIEGKTITLRKIAERTGLATSTVDRHLRVLHNQGKVVLDLNNGTARFVGVQVPNALDEELRALRIAIDKVLTSWNQVDDGVNVPSPLVEALHVLATAGRSPGLGKPISGLDMNERVVLASVATDVSTGQALPDDPEKSQES